MKALKILLIAIVALLALLVGGGLLLSPKFTVSRTVTINAAPEKIYALVADPREWKAWSAWNQRDPAMTIEYSGPAFRIGALAPGQTLGSEINFLLTSSINTMFLSGVIVEQRLPLPGSLPLVLAAAFAWSAVAARRRR